MYTLCVNQNELNDLNKKGLNYEIDNIYDKDKITISIKEETDFVKILKVLDREPSDINKKYKTLGEVVTAYLDLQKNHRMVQVPGRNIYEYENADKRKKLKELYDSMLPKNQKLAIKLHKTLCHCNHTDCCSWYYEFVEDIAHNWEDYAHKKYLKMADDMLNVTDNVDEIMALVDCINA
jgi:hypothetical protein